jgi:hypothetical protein
MIWQPSRASDLQSRLPVFRFFTSFSTAEGTLGELDTAPGGRPMGIFSILDSSDSSSALKTGVKYGP